MTLREAMEVRNSCRLHLPGARTPGRGSPVILLLSTFDTDLMSARAAQDVVPYRYANSACLLVAGEIAAGPPARPGRERGVA